MTRGSCKRYNYISVKIVLLFKLMNRRLIGKSPKFEFGVCLFESNRFKLYIIMLFYTPQGGLPYPHPIFIILYYIVRVGLMSILKNFYYYIYIPTSLSPPLAGGNYISGMWKMLVKVRKYVIIYLMREYCLMVKQLSFKQPMLGSIPAILITPPIISPAPLRGARGSDKGQLLITQKITKQGLQKYKYKKLYLYI